MLLLLAFGDEEKRKNKKREEKILDDDCTLPLSGMDGLHLAFFSRRPQRVSWRMKPLTLNQLLIHLKCVCAPCPPSFFFSSSLLLLQVRWWCVQINECKDEDEDEQCKYKQEKSRRDETLLLPPSSCEFKSGRFNGKNVRREEKREKYKWLVRWDSSRRWEMGPGRQNQVEETDGQRSEQVNTFYVTYRCVYFVHRDADE